MRRDEGQGNRNIGYFLPYFAFTLLINLRDFVTQLTTSCKKIFKFSESLINYNTVLYQSKFRDSVRVNGALEIMAVMQLGVSHIK